MAWLGGLPEEPQGLGLIQAIWLAAAAGKRLVLFLYPSLPLREAAQNLGRVPRGRSVARSRRVNRTPGHVHDARARREGVVLGLICSDNRIEKRKATIGYR